MPLPTWIPGTLLSGNSTFFLNFPELLTSLEAIQALSKSHNVSLRTVHLDILALEEVYTWATVSSVSAMATLTPATLRLASARYEALNSCMTDIGVVAARF